jgi:DNA polymerase-3 subunit delta
MARLTPSALRKQLASGTCDPVYLVVGEDEAEKASVAVAFTETIEEDLRAFNVERFYGGEARPAQILDAARTLPLLAPRRLILVLQAERVLTPKSESEAAERDLQLVESYIKAPEPHTAIVFVAGDLDRRRRLPALLLRAATVVECEGIESAANAEAWIRARAAQAGVTVQPGAIRLLASLAGTDIGRLRADMERLLLYAAGQKFVTAADVREVVGPATAEGGWALANAIEAGDAPGALRELALLLDAGAVPYMLLGQLAWLARTKTPFARAAGAIEAVFRTDLALKTSSGDPRVLLERLVVELCGERSTTTSPKGGGRVFPQA